MHYQSNVSTYMVLVYVLLLVVCYHIQSCHDDLKKNLWVDLIVSLFVNRPRLRFHSAKKDHYFCYHQSPNFVIIKCQIKWNSCVYAIWKGGPLIIHRRPTAQIVFLITTFYYVSSMQLIFDERFTCYHIIIKLATIIQSATLIVSCAIFLPLYNWIYRKVRMLLILKPNKQMHL